MIRSLLADLVDSNGRLHRSAVVSNADDNLNQHNNISRFPSEQCPQPSSEQCHQRAISSVSLPRTQYLNHHGVQVPSGVSTAGRRTSFRQASVFDILSPPGTDADTADAEDDGGNDAGDEQNNHLDSEELLGLNSRARGSADINNTDINNAAINSADPGDDTNGSTPGPLDDSAAESNNDNVDDDVDDSESSGGLARLTGSGHGTVSRYSDNEQDEEHLDDIERVFAGHDDSIGGLPEEDIPELSDPIRAENQGDYRPFKNALGFTEEEVADAEPDSELGKAFLKSEKDEWDEDGVEGFAGQDVAVEGGSSSAEHTGSDTALSASLGSLMGTLSMKKAVQQASKSSGLSPQLLKELTSQFAKGVTGDKMRDFVAEMKGYKRMKDAEAVAEGTRVANTNSSGDSNNSGAVGGSINSDSGSTGGVRANNNLKAVKEPAAKQPVVNEAEAVAKEDTLVNHSSSSKPSPEDTSSAPPPTTSPGETSLPVRKPEDPLQDNKPPLRSAQAATSPSDSSLPYRRLPWRARPHTRVKTEAELILEENMRQRKIQRRKMLVKRNEKNNEAIFDREMKSRAKDPGGWMKPLSYGVKNREWRMGRREKLYHRERLQEYEEGYNQRIQRRRFVNHESKKNASNPDFKQNVSKDADNNNPSQALPDFEESVGVEVSSNNLKGSNHNRIASNHHASKHQRTKSETTATGIAAAAAAAATVVGEAAVGPAAVEVVGGAKLAQKGIAGVKNLKLGMKAGMNGITNVKAMSVLEVVPKSVPKSTSNVSTTSSFESEKIPEGVHTEDNNVNATAKTNPPAKTIANTTISKNNPGSSKDSVNNAARVPASHTFRSIESLPSPRRYAFSTAHEVGKEKLSRLHKFQEEFRNAYDHRSIIFHGKKKHEQILDLQEKARRKRKEENEKIHPHHLSRLTMWRHQPGFVQEGGVVEKLVEAKKKILNERNHVIDLTKKYRKEIKGFGKDNKDLSNQGENGGESTGSIGESDSEYSKSKSTKPRSTNAALHSAVSRMGEDYQKIKHLVHEAEKAGLRGIRHARSSGIHAEIHDLLAAIHTQTEGGGSSGSGKIMMNHVMNRLRAIAEEGKENMNALGEDIDLKLLGQSSSGHKKGALVNENINDHGNNEEKGNAGTLSRMLKIPRLKMPHLLSNSEHAGEHDDGGEDGESNSLSSKVTSEVKKWHALLDTDDPKHIRSYFKDHSVDDMMGHWREAVGSGDEHGNNHSSSDHGNMSDHSSGEATEHEGQLRRALEQAKKAITNMEAKDRDENWVAVDEADERALGFLVSGNGNDNHGGNKNYSPDAQLGPPGESWRAFGGNLLRKFEDKWKFWETDPASGAAHHRMDGKGTAGGSAGDVNTDHSGEKSRNASSNASNTAGVADDSAVQTSTDEAPVQNSSSDVSPGIRVRRLGPFERFIERFHRAWVKETGDEKELANVVQEQKSRRASEALKRHLDSISTHPESRSRVGSEREAESQAANRGNQMSMSDGINDVSGESKTDSNSRFGSPSIMLGSGQLAPKSVLDALRNGNHNARHAEHSEQGRALEASSGISKSDISDKTPKSTANLLAANQFIEQASTDRQQKFEKKVGDLFSENIGTMVKGDVGEYLSQGSSGSSTGKTGSGEAGSAYDPDRADNLSRKLLGQVQEGLKKEGYDVQGGESAGGSMSNGSNNSSSNSSGSSDTNAPNAFQSARESADSNKTVAGFLGAGVGNPLLGAGSAQKSGEQHFENAIDKLFLRGSATSSDANGGASASSAHDDAPGLDNTGPGSNGPSNNGSDNDVGDVDTAAASANNGSGGSGNDQNGAPPLPLGFDSGAIAKFLNSDKASTVEEMSSDLRSKAASFLDIES